jgi:hypothetical protein
MTGERDEGGDMRRSPLDRDTADRLLAGQVRPEDAPRGYEEVARLMAVATGPASADELTGEAVLVPAIANVVAAAAGGATSRRRKFMRARPFTAKVAGAAAVAVLLTATAAAAATNSLPGPAQTAVSDAASHVGVNVPKHHGNPHDATTTDATGAPSTPGNSGHVPGNGHAKGPDATGPAAFGLCMAFSTVTTNDPQSHSVAYRNLAKAASDKGMTVTAYCLTVKPPTANGDSSTSATEGSDTDNGDNSQKPATPPGKANGQVHPDESTSTTSTTSTTPGNSAGHSQAGTHKPADAGSQGLPSTTIVAHANANANPAAFVGH